MTPPIEDPVPKLVPKPVRRKLPDERQAITHKFSIAGHEGYITVGLYDDGIPGEIFITMDKEGSMVSGLLDCFAASISFSLQYGVPLGFLVAKFSHVRFEPRGWTGNQQIPYAKSIMDYMFRWLGSRFLNLPPVAELNPQGLIAHQECAGKLVLREDGALWCAICGWAAKPPV